MTLGRRFRNNRRRALSLLVGVALLGTGLSATNGRVSFGATVTGSVPPPSGAVTFRPPPPRPAPRPLAPPKFGTNSQVNQGPFVARGPHVEPSIASDPADRLQQVAGYAESIGDYAPGVAVTTNGGATWAAPPGGADLPNPPGLTWGNRSAVGSIAAGDSAVAWSTGSTVYFSTLGFQDNSNPPTPNVCNVGGIFVYRSNDGGKHWTLPAGGPAEANTQLGFTDKEYIASDSFPRSAHAGTVYMTWDEDMYNGCPQNFSSNFSTRNIEFSRSTDGGTTWSAPAVLGTGCLVASVPAVSPDGSLHVVWNDCNNATSEVVRTSTDGGATFGAVVTAGVVNVCSNPLPNEAFRVNAQFPSIGTDPTNASRVYVAWQSCLPSGASDILLAHSTDGGKSWSSPVTVNDDQSVANRDEFFPQLTVDDKGDVLVMFGDTRSSIMNADGHYLYDIYLGESVDVGQHLLTNIRVTTQSLDPDVYGPTYEFIGDYFGIAPAATPAWTDTRTGIEDIFAAAPKLIAATVSITPKSGPPGDRITIFGTGYPSGEKVTINYRSPVAQLLCSALVTRAGTISCKGTIPTGAKAGTPGSHTVTATGKNGGVLTTARTIFTLT